MRHLDRQLMRCRPYLVMWLAACGGQEVSRADYGSSWPLTVEAATLFCAEDAVWVLIDGDRYALNGWARTYKDLPALPRSNFGATIQQSRD